MNERNDRSESNPLTTSKRRLRKKVIRKERNGNKRQRGRKKDFFKTKMRKKKINKWK